MRPVFSIFSSGRRRTWVGATVRFMARKFRLYFIIRKQWPLTAGSQESGALADRISAAFAAFAEDRDTQHSQAALGSVQSEFKTYNDLQRS